MKCFPFAFLVFIAAAIIEPGATAASPSPSPGPSASPGMSVEAIAANYDLQGRALDRAGNYAAAIEMYNKALAAYPTDATVYADRGVAYSEAEDYISSLADLDRAITLDPDYAFAYEARCDTRDRMTDERGAIEDCTKAIELDPSRETAWERRGRAQLYSGDLKSADTDLSKAIALNGSDADAYADRCNTRRIVEDIENARADCEQALTLKPDNPFALEVRGSLEVDTGEYASAIIDLNKCLAKDSTLANCYYYRGRSYSGLYEWDKAKSDYAAYLLVRSHDGDAMYDKALAEKNLGDFKSATIDAKAALKQYKIDGDLSDAKDAQSLIDSMHG